MPKFARRNRIRELAALNGITISRLANAIEMQAHTLRRYTRHEAEPKLEIAQKIANYFSVPVNDVLGFEARTEGIGILDSKPPPHADGVVGASIEYTSSKDSKIPLYGVSLNNEIAAVDCPSWITAPAGAYAVFVDGIHGHPRLALGSLAYVDTHIPVRENDVVVVRTKNPVTQEVDPTWFFGEFKGYNDPNYSFVIGDSALKSHKININYMHLEKMYKVSGVKFP